jgi:beta-galactosidase
VLTADRNSIRADGRDVVAITASVVDAHGRPVPTADSLIQFDISGDARLLGVGNGDPSNHESVKAPVCRLFNGLSQALIQAGSTAGSLRIRGRSAKLKDATIDVRLNRQKRLKATQSAS